MTPSTALRGSASVFLIAYLGAAFVPSLPEGAYDDARVASLLTGSDQALIVAGGYLWAIAGIAALVFAHLLSSALENPVTAAVVRAAGTGYGLLVLVGSMMFTAIPMGRAVGELPGEPPIEAFRVFTNAGFFAMLVPALLCAATMIVAASIDLRGNAPSWLTTAGLVIAPLCLLGFAWVPQFLVPLWALAAAVGTPVDRGPRVDTHGSSSKVPTAEPLGDR